jgi:5-aminolevulinate synthase
MDYNKFFGDALGRLHDERRYRVWILSGSQAVFRTRSGTRRRERNVVMWCSNDYLGMGQHPKVVGAMVETATRRHRRRRHPQHRRQQPS